MDEDNGLTDEEWRTFLENNPPTIPPFSYTFRGVDDEDLRNSLVTEMSSIASLMSRIVPLGGLDGITIAVDYHVALAELDRGIETSDSFEPTVESFGTGVAMSSGVIRDGQFKTHVVFEASIIGALMSDDPELKALATHTFVHELGHVAEHTLDNLRFGEAMVTPSEDRYEFELYRLSHSCWSEYYASRVSAPWGSNAINGLRELLEGALEQLHERVTAARCQVGPSRGASNDDAATEIINQVSKLMKFAGYVIGHAKGEGIAPIEPKSVHETLLDAIGLTSWFHDLSDTLDSIYDGRHEWSDLSVFHPLHRAFEAACMNFKLELYRSPQYAIAWRIWF